MAAGPLHPAEAPEMTLAVAKSIRAADPARGEEELAREGIRPAELRREGRRPRSRRLRKAAVLAIIVILILAFVITGFLGLLL